MVNHQKKVYTEDGESAINWLKGKGLKDNDIVVYGDRYWDCNSCCSKVYLQEIILESPFTSMVDAAKNVYPYFPIRFLLKDKYESDKKIKNLRSPIIMHGEADKIVPFWMGKKMYELNEPKYSYFSEKDNHMMEYNEKMIVVLKLSHNLTK